MSYLIYLNPGHHRQYDSGATNSRNGLREADVVWDVTTGIVNSIEKILKDNGVRTKVLQSDSLEQIARDANYSNADYFVSIHCNAFNTVAKGTEVEVYSFGTYGEALGKSVQKEIVSSLGTVDRGLKERPGLYVLRNTDMPSILVELAFIDNEEDCRLLETKQNEFANAVAKGILKFLGVDMNSHPEYSDSRIIAPNGKPFEENDIQYLLNQGYTKAEALSFLSSIDKYSNSDMQKAAEYAKSRVGTTGYGNNGCTAWVRDFLLKANHWFGKLMKSGEVSNLLWTPNIYEYAKANGLWKEPSEGGALGDICLLETNYCREDGPDHVVIACGDGTYWGNSSSRNKIVHSSIAGDYGSENIWGYVNTGSGTGRVCSGSSTRSAAEIVGDAGSSSYVNLSPNGKVYEENDIQYLLNTGYALKDAIELLSKDPKYCTMAGIAPNGKHYEENDIQYLINNGYTRSAALALLSSSDKYAL